MQSLPLQFKIYVLWTVHNSASTEDLLTSEDKREAVSYIGQPGKNGQQISNFFLCWFCFCLSECWLEQHFPLRLFKGWFLQHPHNLFCSRCFCHLINTWSPSSPSLKVNYLVIYLYNIYISVCPSSLPSIYIYLHSFIHLKILLKPLNKKIKTDQNIKSISFLNYYSNNYSLDQSGRDPIQSMVGTVEGLWNQI